MNWYIIIILAIGLAMDAVAASIAIGAAGRVVFLDGVKVALSFGAFQFAMPVIGWSLGVTAASLIGGYDHWIAFFILLFIGGKMILDSFSKQSNQPRANHIQILPLLVLSIATSIDALAAGLSLALIDTSTIWLAAGIIGITTVLLSAIGILIGMYIGVRLGGKAKILGGFILIIIGAKILIEHLCSRA